MVGLGEILWDVFPTGKVLGGAPANFAYHAMQQGMNSIVISAIGRDMLGHEIRESLNQKRQNFMLVDTDYPTGTVQVSVSETGIPTYDIRENVAWDHIPLTAAIKDIARITSVVCFGSLAQRAEESRSTIREFLSLVPESAMKIFDINLRLHYYTEEIIKESLQQATILKINDEELAVVAPMLQLQGDDAAMSRQLIEMFQLQMVILTAGGKYSCVYTADDCSCIDTPQVTVVDTVGAGDTFTAVMASSLLQGLSFKQAHEKAVETAAFVCTRKGAMPEYD